MDAHILKCDSVTEIGVPVLDEAHRELLDLHNRIADACSAESSASVVRERIRTFLIYARWHFGEEERHMRQCHFPNYVDHAIDHARLLQDAEDFVSSLGNALEPEDSPAIASYFKYWLTRHMISKDAEFSAFLNARVR